ncbi:antirestriction protein [Vibrio scophthalmi]|uniref:Antirestriction protein n=1 Tax=Vibrio scophthalmi LMG 19158 TaxID=870967 RepID=F9RMY8_9VIBR|nr:antirestriction protein [Vibrio scophthalmi]EGU37784.1 hypothetical protein VIS19158_10119 [Vibrio scophthalmi LMG 19158]
MITASIVPVEERFNFFPLITKQYIYFERAIYHFADKFVQDKRSAYWEFATISNGGKFCYPKSSSALTLVNVMNYQTVTLSAEAAGICIMLVVFSHYSMIAYEHEDGDEMERFAQLHSQLEAYAMLHPEWSKIGRFID